MENLGVEDKELVYGFMDEWRDEGDKIMEDYENMESPEKKKGRRGRGRSANARDYAFSAVEAGSVEGYRARVLGGTSFSELDVAKEHSKKTDKTNDILSQLLEETKAKDAFVLEPAEVG